MHKEAAVSQRSFLTRQIETDLIIVGGGCAGVCAAITAARAGIKVVLVQDRPVLGGNASSEVRLWVLGATSHMNNNNRWAREGGVIDELLVENMYRNPEGNPLIFDTILLEKTITEPNIQLLLNTAVYEVEKSDLATINSVQAFCSQNSTIYRVMARLVCDASGDGAVGFLAGAAFRMGAESREEFGEDFAPSQEYGELLGHSIYFYTKDVGKPVRFVPPAFALKDISDIPRFRQFNAQDYGCKLWWIEYGGRLDTVHDSEAIKWELWKIVYGVWDYIKNSGQFPEAANLTLEWVGHIPGKRESRRFEGDYMLIQPDLIEQRQHYDAVAYGGWSIDLHPADGIFSEQPGCNQWHSRGVYQIPYRCLYSRNIKNLFLAGRIISASHVAFGSTRVMATAAYTAQAVGVAAALCKKYNLLPAQLSQPENIECLQLALVRTGQHIPATDPADPLDLAKQAIVSASSQLHLTKLEPDGPLVSLAEASWGQMLPVEAGQFPAILLLVNAEAATTLVAELRASNRPDNYTPDVLLATLVLELPAGDNQKIRLDFEAVIDQPRYVFVCVRRNPALHLRTGEQRLTGLLSVATRVSRVSSNPHIQLPPPDIGVESFEFWTARRRPAGQNLAFWLDSALEPYRPANVTNGRRRPTAGANAWVADPVDPAPTLKLTWKTPQTIARLELDFDTDFDHPMETVLQGHPENTMPFCVMDYLVCDGNEQPVYEKTGNYQTRNTVYFDPPLITDRLAIHFRQTNGGGPPGLFEVGCYSSKSNF